LINEFDIVRVVKKTRAKFKNLNKAEPNRCYLVTSTYTPAATYSRYGYIPTTKAFLLDETNNLSFTTETCLERVCNLYDYAISPIMKDKWLIVKKAWMEKEYVPVMVQHKYRFDGFPMIESKDRQAYLVKPVHKDIEFWVNISKIHDDDLKTFTTSSFPVDMSGKNKFAEVVTVRVPLWFAKGKGLF